MAPKNKSKKKSAGTPVAVAPAAPAVAEDAPPAYGSSAVDQNTEPAPSNEAAAPLPPPPPPPAVSEQPPSEPILEEKASEPTSTKKPTAEAPFNFPSDAPPSYTPSTSSSSEKQFQPIAIPQSLPKPSSPFIPAYAPVLLGRGITAASWQAFVSTLSAFLSASVSDRALAHAGDVARRVGDRPTGFAKNLMSHVQSVGRDVAGNARSGNVVGAAFKLIGGAISIPIHAAVGTAATAVSLPGIAVSAAVKTPQTPRARAAAYLVVANQDWLAARGLHAELMDSKELSQLVGASVTSVADAVKGSAKKQGPNAEAAIQLKGLEDYIAELQLEGEGITLELGDATLWLVLRHRPAEEANGTQASGKKA